MNEALGLQLRKTVKVFTANKKGILSGVRKKVLFALEMSTVMSRCCLTYKSGNGQPRKIYINKEQASDILQQKTEIRNIDYLTELDYEFTAAVAFDVDGTLGTPDEHPQSLPLPGARVAFAKIENFCSRHRIPIYINTARSQNDCMDQWIIDVTKLMRWQILCKRSSSEDTPKSKLANMTHIKEQLGIEDANNIYLIDDNHANIDRVRNDGFGVIHVTNPNVGVTDDNAAELLHNLTTLA